MTDHLASSRFAIFTLNYKIIQFTVHRPLQSIRLQSPSPRSPTSSFNQQASSPFILLVPSNLFCLHDTDCLTMSFSNVPCLPADQTSVSDPSLSDPSPSSTTPRKQRHKTRQSKSSPLRELVDNPEQIIRRNKKAKEAAPVRRMTAIESSQRDYNHSPTWYNRLIRWLVTTVVLVLVLVICGFTLLPMKVSPCTILSNVRLMRRTCILRKED